MNKVYLSGIVSDNPRQLGGEGQAPHTVFPLCVRHMTSAGVVKKELYRINAWNRTAEFCRERLAKGMKIAVEGYLTQRVFQAGDVPNVSVEVAADELFIPAKDQPTAQRTAQPAAQPMADLTEPKELEV